MELNIAKLAHTAQENSPHRINDLIKRVVDVVASLTGLFLLAPFFVLIGIGIKLDSRGPIFYKGPRSAKNGGVFYILKFRTMYEDSLSYQGAKVTAKNDQRITPWGRWLRDTKLNELPQLWNVLIGEMSLVGPRPEDPDIVATWPKDLQQEILAVRPGITSPASIIYRHEEEMLDTKDVMSTYMKSILPSKMRLDQLYTRNRSLLVDIDVLIWTLLVLLPPLGSYRLPEEDLFWGPISRLFRRYVNWFVVDVVIILCSFGLTGLLWGLLNAQNALMGTIISFGFALAFSTTGAIMGVNRISWSKAVMRDAIDLIPGLSVATIATLIINSVFGVFPSGSILLAAILSYNGLIATRYRSYWLPVLISRIWWIRRSAASVSEKVLIVDSGNGGQFLAKMLSYKESVQTYKVVGFIDDDYFQKGKRIRGLEVLGGSKDIPALVQRHDVGIIILAGQNIDPRDRQKVLEYCHQTQARVFQASDFLMPLHNIASSTENSHPVFEPMLKGVKNDVQLILSHPSSKRDYDREGIAELAERVFNRSLKGTSPLIAIALEMEYQEPMAGVPGDIAEDRRLASIANQCKKSLRAFDLLWQYDQRKLMLLMPDTLITTAGMISDRLLTSIAESDFYRDQGNFAVRLNLGVAEKTSETTSLALLIDRATENLMAAKQSKQFLNAQKSDSGSQNMRFGSELSV